MNEVSCKNCRAACCKGPKILELTADEAEFMEDGGTILHEIAAPTDHSRSEVIFPVGIDSETGEPVLLEGYEHRSLKAGFGRYLLLGVWLLRSSRWLGKMRCV